MNETNDIIMQFFEWYLPADSMFWKDALNQIDYLASLGINYVWLPPAYKGASGIFDVGYCVYDLYDLGEFNQKGDIKTKYGTKEEYLNCIKAFQSKNIKVLADIVFNQKMGADETEDVIAIEDNPVNRNQAVSEPHEIRAWTKFTFPRKKRHIFFF